MSDMTSQDGQVGRSGHRSYLGLDHPVAEVAGRFCRAHLGSLRLSRIGRVACGACWERAIRDDERAVVLFGVPREIEPDPSYVDEVAVERACRGEAVALTPVERAEVNRRVREAARKAAEFEDLGWLSSTEVRRIRRSSVDWKGRPKSSATPSLDGEVAA